MTQENKVKRVAQAALEREINISTALTKTDKKWKNKTIKWGEFLDMIEHPVVTSETADEYRKLSKARRDAIKDVGGFVGGFLKQGRRKADNVQSRSLITLDADSPRPDLWDDVKLLFDNAAAVYSTHSHTDSKPRIRIIIPLDRVVTPDEYQPIARKVAELFGMDNFDDTTYQPERLMYKPSRSSDGDYMHDVIDGPFLDPDEILAQYTDWRDSSFWPESSRGNTIRERQAKKQGDPIEKKGIIGAFCRTYDIRSAIAEFLGDVYEETGHDNRYTYVEGSTSGGLVLYDDKFAYSHHSTDPVGDMLTNAFDLVRIHKFGDQDEDAKDNTPVNRLPSFKAMREFALTLPAVRGTMADDRIEAAASDFDDVEVSDEPEQPEDKEWRKRLEFDERGEIASSATNLELIMQHDPNLKGRFFIDNFANRLVIGRNTPWRKLSDDNFWKDTDDAGLRVYLEKVYGIVSRGKIEDAFAQETERNAVHPVREYLDTLEWDETPRLETLLIDYLGAEDTPYTRLVTRKFLAAAVARIYVPGVKFDYMLVTSGPQGIGKTELPAIMAGRWFSNSLENVQGKDAYEAVQGVWIMEMGEMTATKKADIEATKHFISKREDVFRVAYGRHKSYFKRQVVFWGTSNDGEFLRDKTGNRRFWPVDVGVRPAAKSMWEELTPEVRDQLWAEAKHYWQDGERLYLNHEEEGLAVEQQQRHTESNALEGMIEEFLDAPITHDWYDKTPYERREYMVQDPEMREAGTVKRTRVCVIEIWVELLGGDPKNLIPIKASEIRNTLANMDGWSRYDKSRGRMRFGAGYGVQTAFVSDSELF